MTYLAVHALRGQGGARKYIDEGTIKYSQVYIPFFGHNFANAHIAAWSRFRQIDVAVRAGVDLRAMAIIGGERIRRDDLDGLRLRADAAVLAGQVDIPTSYSHTAFRLGDIPRGVQRHIPQHRIFVENSAAVLALQCQDFHIPRQDFISQHTADGGNVDISLAGGNGVQLDIVRHIAICVFRAEGSNMEACNIVMRRQPHILAS